MRIGTYILINVVTLLFSCNQEPELSPRPRAYPKVDFPNRNPLTYNELSCPFTFSYPDYFEVRRDSFFFDKRLENPCWFNLHGERFNADLHCTYTPISSYPQFQQLVQDAFKLANEQNKRASYIEDFRIVLPNGISGMAFNMEGPSASPFQFFLTDSTHHFFRASLYFNTRPNPDSLQPVADFVRKDMTFLIQSFQWKGSYL